jgi:hypothetical protein
MIENYNAIVSKTEKVITFTIESNKTILDDEISMYNDKDEVDPLIIDKLVKEFNRISNGLIVDYNYKVLNNKKGAELEILFKHVFSKFGETQKYVVFFITYDEKNKIVEAKSQTRDIGLNVRNCQLFPFNRIHITNAKHGDKNTTVINAYSVNDLSIYKNYNMIIDFTKKLIHENYKNIENYVKITKGN